MSEIPREDRFVPGEEYWRQMAAERQPRTEAEFSMRRLAGISRLSRTEAQGAGIPVRPPESEVNESEQGGEANG